MLMFNFKLLLYNKSKNTPKKIVCSSTKHVDENQQLTMIKEMKL